MCEVRSVPVYLIWQLPQRDSICLLGTSGQCRSVMYYSTVCLFLETHQTQYSSFAFSPRSADMQCIWTHPALHFKPATAAA